MIYFQTPYWLLRILPRKWMVSIIRKRMIHDFKTLGMSHNDAVNITDKAINEGK